MNIEKIEIKPNQYVWVDKDAEIKEGDYFYHSFINQIILSEYNSNKYDISDVNKIIAASPELNLEGVPTYVEWLSMKDLESYFGSDLQLSESGKKWVEGYTIGYQTAEKELQPEQRVKDLEKRLYDCSKTNADLIGKINELPTWDDVRKAIELAQTVKDYGNYKPYTEEEIIEQLKQDKL